MHQSAFNIITHCPPLIELRLETCPAILPSYPRITLTILLGRVYHLNWIKWLNEAKTSQNRTVCSLRIPALIGLLPDVGLDGDLRLVESRGFGECGKHGSCFFVRGDFLVHEG